MTASLETVPGAPTASPLAAAATPRPDFLLSRKLAGANRWPLLLLTMIYGLNVADQYLVPTVFPLLKDEFGLSDSSLGILSGSYVIVVMLFSIPFGYIADRWNRTRVISWGTAAWGATMIFTGSVWNYGSLLVARMSLGAWDPCDNPTSQSLLADYYPKVQRSKVMSVYQVGQLTGVFLIPVAAGIATKWGWRSAFYFLAIPAFIVAILARQLPEPVRGQQDRRQLGLDAAAVADTKRPAKEEYREILRTPTFMLMMVSSTVGSVFFGALGTWSPTFFVRYHDMTVSEAATALILLALGGLSGALLSGWAADYATYRGLRAGRIVIAAGARLIGFPLFLITFTMNNTPLMLVAFAFAALALTAPQPPINAARADVLHPELRGRGTSLDTVVQSTASAIAPVVVGFLADAYGLRTALLVMSPLMALSGLILLVAIPTYVRDERNLRHRIRLEAAGDTDTDQVGLEEFYDESDRRPGETAGQAAIRLARTAPTVEEGGDLLAVENVDVAYGQIQVLFDANFRVPEGGVHAIVGRNGVGKTTLLNTIAGLIETRRGSVMYDGLDLTGVPAEQRVKLGITLMGGGRSTFPTLTVEENLWIGSFPFHERHALVQERLDAVLEVFPALRPRLRQSGGTLSGGEQQMVALARSLMAGPRLLMLDELSIGLAPVVTQDLLGVVHRIKELGTTVIIVEQSVPNALSVADTVTFMDKGAIVPVGRAAELGDGQILVDMMMGVAQ